MKIAFGYKMGVGKDEAVKYLSKKYGGTVISFAEPIYDIMRYAQRVTGFPQVKDRKFLQMIGTEWGRNIDNNVWINKALEKVPKEDNPYVFSQVKDRKFLQMVGTEWGRNKNNNVWINKSTEKNLKEYNAYISDLRFLNEFETLKENNWICVKLIRETDNNRAGSGSTHHISENILDNVPNHNWDFVIENNGTLEEFYEKLDKLFE